MKLHVAILWEWQSYCILAAILDFVTEIEVPPNVNLFGMYIVTWMQISNLLILDKTSNCEVSV